MRSRLSRKETVCAKCGQDPVLSLRYDRFFCQLCDIWIEDPCNCSVKDSCPFPKAPSVRPSKCGELDVEKHASCRTLNNKTKYKV